MNILLSYNWLKEYIDIKQSPQELAELLSLHSMSVEKILPESELLSDKIVLGEVVEVKPHPDADRLLLTTVNDGQENLQIVCGMRNIKPGMKVALAKLGAVVKWHGEGEPVELKEAEVRGIKSYGMICDDSEIGLSDERNPEGATDYEYLKAKVGTPLAKAMGMDDVIFDVEVTTNRVDAASVIGMVWEIAAITGLPVNQKFSEVLSVTEFKTETDKQPLKITIEDKEKCLGFNGIVLDNVKVGPSPEWLQRRLRSIGHTPINNIVDVTNYVMREIGNPLHSFDYNKIKDGHLIIRSAKKDEELETLDDSLVAMQPFMAVVADENKARAIGGVMGGKESMISEQTTTVLLEAASWDSQTVRKTAMKLDKHSDASSYFAKGISPQQAIVALTRAVILLQEIAGAKVVSKVVSEGYKPYKSKKVEMDIARAELYIGDKLDIKKVQKQLESMDFIVSVDKEKIICEVPHWRQYDIRIEEDLIEEVARLYGYHNIENALPEGKLPTPVFDKHIEYEDRIKTLMKSSGYTEVYSYSMVSEDLLRVSNRNIDQAIRLLNPLDDDHVVMRTRLLPSLIEVVAQNQGVVDEQNIFEISNVYIPVKKDALPDEHSEFALVIIGDDIEKGVRYAKGIVLLILEDLGLAKQTSLIASTQADLTKAGSSLDVVVGDKLVGNMGVVKSSVLKSIGLKKKAVVVELSLHEIIEIAKPGYTYTPIPKFPPIVLDLSILVRSDVKWKAVEKKVKEIGGEILKTVELFDVYHQKDEKKSFAFHLTYRDEEKTLKMKDVELIQKNIVDKLGGELGAVLRG